ncbi:MAG: hypothetical protein LBQ33_05825 [Oscillospiraceae bacterium]|jgi:hypothetical protein|nr:hypothetical protein [Oscillospiraceae bacterium]
MPDERKASEESMQQRLARLLLQLGDEAPPQDGRGRRIPMAEIDQLLDSVRKDIALQTQPDEEAALQETDKPCEAAQAPQERTATREVPAAALPEQADLREAAIDPREVTQPKPEPDPLRLDLFGANAGQPPLDIAPAAEYVRKDPVEKPGFILRRVDEQMTTDLSPVPRIVPAEELRQQQKQEAPTAEEADAVPEGQQRFPYFDELEEPPGNLSEDELRALLERGRAQRAQQFRVLRELTDRMEESGETGVPPAPQEKRETEETQAPPGVEYDTPQDRERVFRFLVALRERKLRTALLLALLSLASGIWLACVSFGAKAQTLGSPAQQLPQILFLLAGLLLVGRELLSGAQAILRKKPNADSMQLLAALGTAVQAVFCFFPAPDSGEAAQSFAALFLTMSALQAAARWLQARRVCGNFRFCAYQPGRMLFGVCQTEEFLPVQQRRAVLYPAPIQFPAQFVAQSLREDAVDAICRWLLSAGLGLAAIAGLSAGFAVQSAAAAAAAAAAVLCMTMPAGALFALYQTMQSLTGRAGRGKDAAFAILNTQAAEELSRAGGVLVDSGDLFRKSKGRMHGWREYWQVRTDEVLLYAAAIAIASGGPLQAVFEGVVEGDHSVLPELRQLTYEDRMGLSCWIHNQKVFFGNRSLLNNHNISVTLSEKEERAYEHDGRKILYLAVEKRLAAFFVVSYRVEDALSPYFQRLVPEDMQLQVCNGDPSITKEILAGGFSLPEPSVSLLRAKQSQSGRARMRTVLPEKAAPVLHVGSLHAFLCAVTACTALSAGIKRLRVLHLIGGMTAFLLMLTAALTHQLSAANALVFIAFEVIWTAVTLIGVRQS